MPTEKQRLTFISYSRADKDFALELARELRSSGFLIWLDQWDIPPGARWDDQIEKALTQCEIFMVILTPSSTASDNVKDEIGYAIDNKKQILPVLLENANLPFRLKRFQYVDFTGKNYEEGIEAAKQLLRNLLNEPTAPNVPAPPNKQVQFTPNIPSHPVKRRSEIEAQKPPRQPTRKTLPMLIGIAITSVICLTLAWMAWPDSSGRTTDPSVTPPVATAANTDVPDIPATTALTNHPTIQPTYTNPPPTAIEPRAYGFQACESPCNGQNYSVMFSGGIKKIYVQFNYGDIPSGSKYIRTWDLEGKGEWIRYSCQWDGPGSGTEILKLTEPGGLHSGLWTLTVQVNSKIILQEQITVTGNWKYWAPAGTISACHGTN
jgi:hypothetical protein